MRKKSAIQVRASSDREILCRDVSLNDFLFFIDTYLYIFRILEKSLNEFLTVYAITYN